MSHEQFGFMNLPMLYRLSASLRLCSTLHTGWEFTVHWPRKQRHKVTKKPILQTISQNQE